MLATTARRRLAFIASLLAAVALGAAAPILSLPAQPANASVTAGDIIFTTTRFASTGGVARLKANGDVDDLTSDTLYSKYPAVSSDGSRIVYQSTGRTDASADGLYVMNSDGSGKTQITQWQATSSSCPCHFDENPDWNQAGTQIAFDRHGDGIYRIFKVNADGSGEADLSGSAESYDLGPSWSPNGLKIVFGRIVSGHYTLFVMDADGTDQQQVFSSPSVYNDYQATWASDASKLYFTRSNSGSTDIYSVAVDSSGEATASPVQLTTSGDNDAASASSGGSKISFYSYRDGNPEIYDMNPNGTSQTQRTSDSGADDYPAYVSASWSIKSMAVLGDSYAAGEGVPDFMPPSDTDGCHRSAGAYANVLNETPSGLSLMAFVACSGATSADIVNGRNGEDPQLDAISGDEDFVVLTVGGNNVGFAPFGEDCVVSDCSNSTQYQTTMDAIENDLPDDLDALFDDIGALVGENTRVLILGYPRILPYGSNEFPNCLYITSGERSSIADVTTGLNGAISSAVSRAGNPFEFVNADAVLDNLRVSPFAGHELCSSGSFFNGVDIINQEYSLHPNEAGQAAYAELIRRYLSSS